MAGAFFEPVDGALHPTPAARSPWSAQMLHGRLLAGLAAWAVQRDHGEPDLQPARLTVDLYRYPPMTPVRVDTRLVRGGGRVRVVDSTFATADGVDLGRATMLLLRRAEQPADEIWAPAEWDVPPPEAIEGAPPGPGAFPMQMRAVPGAGFGMPGQRKVWMREVNDLIAGVPLDPLVRVAMAADLASPLSNSGAGGLDFINADITLQLRRLPRSDWLGFEVTGHLSESGVAVGQCRLYDTDGAIGYSSTCAVLTGRMNHGG